MKVVRVHTTGKRHLRQIYTTDALKIIINDYLMLVTDDEPSSLTVSISSCSDTDLLMLSLAFLSE